METAVGAPDDLHVDLDQQDAAAGPGGDARATAVLAVLAGIEPDGVAARYGVDRGVLDRWVRQFVKAGREAMAAGTPTVVEAHRDRYLSLVAHELRSPLALIQGWVDVLREADVDQSVREHALDAVAAQVRRMRRLAADALDATSVALGRLSLDLEARSLAEVVGDVAGNRPVDPPSVHVEEDVVVRVDVVRMGQVLDNLLDNAAKYGSGRASVVVRRRGLFGEVEVHSPGQPIDPAVARRMFEPFERGSSAAAGVGLGLYVCRSLTVAHGGQIGLRATEAGNEFWVRLPAEEGTSR